MIQNNVSLSTQIIGASAIKSKNSNRFISKAASDSISFGLYYPDKHLKKPIYQGVGLIKKAQNIVILTHYNHDGDAIGGSLALLRKIKKAFPSKNISFVLAENVKDGFKFIDSKNEISLIKKGQNIAQYLNSDLVISVDVAERKLFHADVSPILDSAKKVLKIDHHPQNAKASQEEFNFGDVNVVDSTKESASQIVMQFAKPLGLHPESSPWRKILKFWGDKNPKIDSLISDPLALGALTDSGVFSFIKNPAFFNDMAELSKTTDFAKIRKDLFKHTLDDFLGERDISQHIKFSDDKSIAHFILGKEFDCERTEKLSKNLLAKFQKTEGINHAFYIQERKDGSVTASVRSNYPVKSVIEEIGGGGHDAACGLRRKDITAEQLSEMVYEQLKKVTVQSQPQKVQNHT